MHSTKQLRELKMKKLAIATILTAMPFLANASCFSLVSGVLDEVGTAVSSKATSASAISLYVSTCEVSRMDAIYKIRTMEETKAKWKEVEVNLNKEYKDVGTVNYIVGVKSFATFSK
jgi:hypothetical protein